MHDPMTVAFEIRRPWPKRYPDGARYWPSMATIWHVDPERDGTDDSCGWFPRARHGDAATLERIRKAFASEWESGQLGWFDKSEVPLMDDSSIVLDMFLRAAQQIYMGRPFDKHGWRGAKRFCRRHLFEILRFAGNGTDSFHTFIRSSYGVEYERPRWREERIEHAAAIIYGWIMRTERPWYRHPKWHIWHWKIQIHPLQAFKRWLFSRCARCHGRFSWGYAPVSHSWNGSGPRWFSSEEGVYHHGCSGAQVREDA